MQFETNVQHAKEMGKQAAASSQLILGNPEAPTSASLQADSIAVCSRVSQTASVARTRGLQNQQRRKDVQCRARQQKLLLTWQKLLLTRPA